MSKFLRTIMWRQNVKHKKLSEEILHEKNAKNNHFDEDFEDLEEIVSFKLKYLGSTVVEKLNGSVNVSEQAVQCICNNLKAQNNPQESFRKDKKDKKEKRKRSRNTELTVSPKGVCISDGESDILKVSIYRISNCRTHRQRMGIVSFLATDSLETTECHAFLCKGRKSAERVALAMARAFHMAYEQWTNMMPTLTTSNALVAAAEAKTPAIEYFETIDAQNPNQLLIVFDDDVVDNNDKENVANAVNTWVCFEDGQGEDLLC